jgi:hypothetical protein
LPGEPAVFEGERVQRDHTELNSTLTTLGISLVRTNYWIGYRLAFETGERVKFLVLQEPRQVRIPEYEKLPAGLSPDLVPLLLVPAERPVFVGALTTLGYVFEERAVGGYILIYNLKRPELHLKQIENSSIATVIGGGSTPPIAAVDGVASTRWATGAPQRDGQTFEVVFKEPQTIVAFEYSLGEWTQDYPRALRVETEDVGGTRELLLTNEGYRQLLAFWKGQDLRFWFPASDIPAHDIPAHDIPARDIPARNVPARNGPARNVRRVIFSQTGQHPILDWSIAELRFYTGRVNSPVVATADTK